MATFQTENPTNLEPLAEYTYHRPDEIEQALQRADVRAKEWRWTSAEFKSSQLRFLALKLREKKENLALTMALEMGKPIGQGRTEVEKCAQCCEYYAGIVGDLAPSETVKFDQHEHRIQREPMGLVFAIMPWNFPLWQVVRSLVPILAAGNAYILKHSEIVAGTAEIFEKICDETFDSGLVTNFYLTHAQAAQLIADPRIKAITLTGSSKAGSEIAACAGKNLKKCVLELGGSDPVLILNDADIKLAIELSAQSRMINTGQSCISAKRFLVPEDLWKVFLEGFQAQLDEATIGDPHEESTRLGPLAHRRFAEKTRSQVVKLMSEGAKMLWQKQVDGLRGAFVKPAIIHADPSQPSYLTEEFFAPIALVTPYKDIEEAVALANATSFGLGATIVSSDRVRAENLAPRLECGIVAINRIVASDSRLPFGGVKDSGYGRELGRFGVQEFQNVKTLLL
jgi:succinate-semialdehyde dehydrogenase/glutarate-semialdehyde dehydrogenase